MWELKNRIMGIKKSILGSGLELTWRDKLQARTDMLQPLLDQFPRLALLDAAQGKLRLPESVSATRDRLPHTIFNTVQC